MTVRFEVDGLPPKKDGANAMWRKVTEVPRLKALRMSAAVALGGHRFDAGSVRLSLTPGLSDSRFVYMPIDATVTSTTSSRVSVTFSWLQTRRH